MTVANGIACEGSRTIDGIFASRGKIDELGALLIDGDFIVEHMKKVAWHH